MLKKLASLIEKRPIAVITIIIIITIILATFIPSIKMETNFQEFMPEDEIVQANQRVEKYFGQQQQVMLIYYESQRANNILSVPAIKEQNFIQQKITKNSHVTQAIGVPTLVNQTCQIEFGKTLEECTKTQITTVVDDLFGPPPSRTIQALPSNDPNEKTDYNPPSLFNRGKSIDSIDIKNTRITYTNQSLTFAIQVHDLSGLADNLNPPLPLVNVMEWYIDFDNLITPAESLDIDYRIAAHVEPTHPLWEIGKGPLNNLQTLFQNTKQRELFNSFETTTYLWIKPPNQTIYFPFPLKTGDISLNRPQNSIEIQVDRAELGKYGIAPSLGPIELPAKLSSFSVGSRYYNSPIGRLPWMRITANTTFLLNSLQKIQNRPLLGPIAERLFHRVANFSFEEFNDFISNVDQMVPLPDRIALKEIDSQWNRLDQAPDTTCSNKILFIRPHFFQELQVNAETLVSKNNQAPTASLMILQLNISQGYENVLEANKALLFELKDLDAKQNYVVAEATGNGVVSYEINQVTSAANQLLMPAIFIIILLILLINFRRFSYMILPMVTLLVASIWLFGTMALLGISFSVIGVALVPLVIGLGVDYAVHLFHNYRAELKEGKNPVEAIKKSVKEIGTAIFLAMLTTVIAFLSFLTSSVPPIRNFGILLAFGVTYTFIATITLLPALRLVIDRKKTVKIPKKLNFFSVDTAMNKLAKGVLTHRKKIIIIVILVSLVVASGAFRLETGFHMEQFLPEDSPSVELWNKIAEKFPYASQEQEYILIEGDVATVDTLAGIAQTHDNLQDDKYLARNPDGSVQVKSIYSIIQQRIRNNVSLIKKFNIDEKTGIPQTDSDVKALYDYLYEGSSFQTDNSFMSGDTETESSSGFSTESFSSEVSGVLHRKDSQYTAALIRVYIDPALGGREENFDDESKVLYNELKQDVVPYDDVTATVTGPHVITLTITDSLTESQILSTGISLILAAIVLIIAYRNPLLGLIVMLPVCVTILWILGSMYFIGFTLNAMTITVTSITIGIGIDYAIHATERFRLIADKTGDVTKAMCETISHTGGALLISALTTTCGFGILVLAPVPPQQQFGTILAITIMYSFITSVLILPLVLVRWAGWRKKRKGFIISPRKAGEVEGGDLGAWQR